MMRRAPTAPAPLDRSGSGAWSTTSGDYSPRVHGDMRTEPSAPKPLYRSISDAWSTTSGDYSPRASASRGELGAAYSPRGKKSHPDHLKSNRWIISMPSLLQPERSRSRFAPVGGQPDFSPPEKAAGATSEQSVPFNFHIGMRRAGREAGSENMGKLFNGFSGMDRKARGDSCPPPMTDPIAWATSPPLESPRAMRRLGYAHAQQTFSLAGSEATILPLPMQEPLHTKKGFEDVYKPRPHNRRNSLRTHFLAGHEDMFTPKPRPIMGPDLEPSAGHKSENDKRFLGSADRVITPRVNPSLQSSSDLPLSLPRNCANPSVENIGSREASADPRQELDMLRKADPPTPRRESRQAQSPGAARAAARSATFGGRQQPRAPAAQSPRTPARTPLRLFRDPLAN